MFISKKHIHRRAVLKGAGATLALPLLGRHASRCIGGDHHSRRKTAEALRVYRLPAWRDHGSLVAQGNRHELHHVADPHAARAVPQASHHRLRLA